MLQLFAKSMFEATRTTPAYNSEAEHKRRQQRPAKNAGKRRTRHEPSKLVHGERRPNRLAAMLRER